MSATDVGAAQVTLETFGGLVLDTAPTDLPHGASPDNQDVAYNTGRVVTRPGLQNVFTALGGNPTINYLKTYSTETLLLRMLALDSLGNFYKENPAGTLASIASGIVAPYAQSTSQFEREYIAFGDGKFGRDIPRQFDDTNFDRVSQGGPGQAPSATDEILSYPLLASPNGLLPLGQSTPYTIVASPNGLSESANLCTVTITAPTTVSLAIGDQIQIAGAGVAGYNGIFTISAVVSPTSFQFVNSTTGLANSGGGTMATGEVEVFTSSTFNNGLTTILIAGAGVAAYNGNWTVRLLPLGTGHLWTYINNFTLTASGGGTVSSAGSITAGVHKVSVAFQTRQGYITAPAPSASWTAAGGKRVILSTIPTGPPNVTARILLFTAAGGSSFFYTVSMVIADNTSTTATIDFSDAILLAGTSADGLFKLVELGECAGVMDYASRLFWWGERNKVENFVNLGFDGGFSSGNPGPLPHFPLGWTLDPTFSPGGASALDQGQPVVWGDAYEIAGNGATPTRGKITQTAYQDSNKVPILLPNTSYSVRARVAKSAALTQGTLHVNLQSTSGSFTTTGLSLAAGAITTSYVEYSAVILSPQATIPTDLVLQLYADGTPSGLGGLFLVDNIEIYLTNQPFNSSLVRASRVEDPESYDGVNGFLQFGVNDGTRVTCAFKLRGNLYFTKERSLWYTADDGVHEPSLWPVSQQSATIGTESVHGVGIGDDWVVIADRKGVYLFDGGEPVKISQEIQPLWNRINWTFGHTLWVTIDTNSKRIMVGAPLDAATSPNVVIPIDYRNLDTAEEIATHRSVRESYTGKEIVMDRARKITRWNMNINSSAMIERADGTAHAFMGNGAGTGKIYDLLDVDKFAVPANFGDDGAAITSYYDTSFLLSPEQEQQYQLGAHRKLFDLMALYVEGHGNLILSAFGSGNFAETAIPQSGVSLPALVDPSATAAITAISRTSGVVTVTTGTAHGLGIYSVVVIAAVTGFNGMFGGLTIVNSTQFSYTQAGVDASSSGGTVSVLARDMEIPINVLAERLKFRFKISALGSWFSLKNITVSVKTDPWMATRGFN